MAKLKSGIVLSEGEELVMEIEAELWADSSNPIAQLIGSIRRILNLLIGNKREGFLVITNKRVYEIIQYKKCWVLNTGKEIKYVLPSSVKEVGYSKAPTVLGCFCQRYEFFYASFTTGVKFQLKDADEAFAQKVVDSFYNAIQSK